MDRQQHCALPTAAEVAEYSTGRLYSGRICRRVPGGQGAKVDAVAGSVVAQLIIALDGALTCLMKL